MTQKEKVSQWNLKLAMNPKTQAERAVDPTAGGGLTPGVDFLLFEQLKDGKTREVDASGYRVEDIIPSAKKALVEDPQGRLHAVSVMDFPLPGPGDLLEAADGWVSSVLDPRNIINAKVRGSIMYLKKFSTGESVSVLLTSQRSFPGRSTVCQYQEQTFSTGRHHRDVRIPTADSVIYTALASGEECVGETRHNGDIGLIGENQSNVTVLPIVLGEANVDQMVVGAILITTEGVKPNPRLLRKGRTIARDLGKVIETERYNEEDFITGALNKGIFDIKAETEIVRSLETNAVIGYGFIDMDKFKQVRDTFGQQVGTDVLRQFVSVAWPLLADVGFIGTTGGDEFGVLFSAQGRDGVIAAAKNIVLKTHENRFTVKLTPDEKDIKLVEGDNNGRIRKKKERGVETVILPRGFSVEELDDGSRIIILPERAVTISMGLSFVDELGDIGNLRAKTIREQLHRWAELYEKTAEDRGRDMLIHAGDIKRRGKR